MERARRRRGGDGTGRARAGRRWMALETAATRRRFTRAEYHRMAEVGILHEDDRVELIRGEIVQMSPPGRRHKAFAGNLSQLLVTRLAGRATVWMQKPIVLTEDTEPRLISRSFAEAQCHTRSATLAARTRCCSSR